MANYIHWFNNKRINTVDRKIKVA
ncbi:hypothetical protein KPP78_10030 [Leuconostoc mesenteroides]|nr:hypothetical protein [Leuconostoc suionicum]MBU7547445.1 hypothetical protein [Leuconostoc mesenteroides]